MQFNSYEFILMLLPVTLLLYFIGSIVGVTVRKLVICVSGAVLYAFAGKTAFLIMIVSIVINYILTEIMMEAAWIRKPALIVTIVLDVLILFGLQYANFAIDNVNLLLGKGMNHLSLAVPVGLSFFTLQQIAYVVAVYKGGIKEIRLLDYLAYIFYFPKLLSGPYVDPEDLIGQLNDRPRGKWNGKNFISGLMLFSFGLFKVVVLSDTLASAASWGMTNFSTATSLDMIIVMLSFTLEIYFNLSGYCDMAVGVSDMMNIKLPQNFNSPYRAVSVTDFWDRWQMSLTGFVRKYVWLPLGGNSKGRVRGVLNLFIMFMIIGIWHGSDWTVLVWGAIYGILCIAEQFAEPVLSKVFRPVRVLITFIIVNILWLLYLAPGIGDWLSMLKTMLLGHSFRLSSGLAACFLSRVQFPGAVLHLNALGIFSSGTGWLVLFMAAGLGICFVPKNNYVQQKNCKYLYMVLAAIAFAWSFLYLGA